MDPRAEPDDRELAVHLAGGTAADLRRLAAPFDDADWLALPPEAWAEAGWPPRWRERLGPWRNREALAHERRRVRRRGVRLVGRAAADFPGWLRDVPDLPVALCVRGRWPPPEEAVAIVGARAATPTGRQAARACGAAAAGAGCAVVSGLARGVDSAAMTAAHDAGGWTIGVLGCGIDVVYPPEHAAFQETVARDGTLISEFPLGTQPSRYTFPRRNRVIAALARQVVVVEAGRRSGALITARHALELGRDVWVVPGAIDSPQSEGSNLLLFDGAQPIVDPGRLPEMLGRSTDGPGGATAERDPLLVALGRRALTPDELADAMEAAVAIVRSRLIALELEGRVLRTGGGRYVRS